MRVRFNRWVCETRYGWYDNGRTAIRLIDVTDNGPVATVTINVPEEPLEDDCIIIKDYSENIGMQLALIEAGVVEPDILGVIQLPYCTCPVHRLSEAAKQEINNVNS